MQGALQGDDRTASNTTTTVQQPMSLFFQDDIRRRCVPGAAALRRVPGTAEGSIDARSRLSFIQRVNATSGPDKKSPDWRRPTVPSMCSDPLRVSLN